MRISMTDLQRQFSEDVKQLNPELFSGAPARSVTVERTLGNDGKEGRPRGNKYGAQKVKIGDRTFDSKAEARRYLDLHAQAQAGTIQDLQCQVRFQLLPAFAYLGKTERAVHYTADFVYRKEGVTVIEDVKSSATARTEAFRLRWRLLLYQFRDRQDVICVTVSQ